MLSRRDLLRTGAAGAAVAVAAPALDLAPVARAAAARATAADFRLGFRSLREEVSIERLPQSGALPSWLRGTLVRNGPALFEVGEERFNHWFDGLAMLHAFEFRGGRVAYANRFLRSSAYEAARTEGRIAFSEFATDPCRAIFNGAAAMFVAAPIPNANVNVVRLAERFVALTEIPIPVQFDPRTLETLGVDGATVPVGELRSAHPHVDGDEVFTYRTKLVPPSAYVIERDDRPLATIPVDRPAYIHSFALTRRYAVLADFPYAVDPVAMVQRWKPVIENYAWEPGRPSRFYVVDRASGRLVAQLEAPPFFAFHHVNAFERDGEVVVDVCAYDDAEVIDALYLKRLRSARARVPQAQLRRYVLDLRHGRVTSRVLAPGTVELPRIHPERDARDYRYAYGVGLRDERRSRFVDQLVKVDVEAGTRRVWREDGCYPGEAVFVAAPGARAEDDGVALSVVLDARARTSFLLVLDGRTFAERARATVPHHIPHGFHGALL